MSYGWAFTRRWAHIREIAVFLGTIKTDYSIFQTLHSQVLSKVKKYTRDPNFKPDKVAHYSVACQSFCQWVLAMERYGRVYRVVQPKVQLHREMDVRLQAVRGKLKVKEDQLREVSAYSGVYTYCQRNIV